MKLYCFILDYDFEIHIYHEECEPKEAANKAEALLMEAFKGDEVMEKSPRELHKKHMLLLHPDEEKRPVISWHKVKKDQWISDEDRYI